MNPFEESDFEFALEARRAVREERMREREYEKWLARQRRIETENAAEAHEAKRRAEAHVDDDVPPLETRWDEIRMQQELRG